MSLWHEKLAVRVLARQALRIGLPAAAGALAAVLAEFPELAHALSLKLCGS